ncbi:MAG: diguanylate cyclase [Actinophytocola sp.]|uniref:GGDEF domain-containing protein n=1 Tax=Actinophytocola sp. TaxID=1872138 RepID=UPI003C7115FA
MVQVRSLAAELSAHGGHALVPMKVDSHVDGGEREDSRLDADRPALDDRSDAWLVGRARELLAITQAGVRVEAARNVAAGDEIANVGTIHEMDHLLRQARRRDEPRLVGQLLRAATVIRVIDSESAESAGDMVEEFLSHARRNKLLVLEADAHALAGTRLLLTGEEDDALSEVAVGLAMIDEKIPPDPMFGSRTWHVLMTSTLMDLGTVLAQLGVYEVADQVMKRANRHIRGGVGSHDISMHLLTRTRLQLGWGLRLERAGEAAEAAVHFAEAAAMAGDIELPFRESLFRRMPDRSAADQVPVIGSAHALGNPSGEHLDRLYGLLGLAPQRELIFVGIALARCLEHTGHLEEAITTLGDVQKRLHSAQAEQGLYLCLIREFARLSSLAGGDDGGERTTSALQMYVAELEAQLSDQRLSRKTTLDTRREHERLSRKHGTVARQALQDPLTGLPNRRALDERLEELSTQVGEKPLAIALVDLDRFKNVNDQLSHADGDDVLRVIASTVRDTLRGSDMVARYGGDEFIVLLPGAPLEPAAAALRRAADAVQGLPLDLSHGVTLSVGVVSLRPGETAARVLARADAAMYQAKRKGGNDVVAISDAAPEDEPDTAESVEEYSGDPA